MSGSRGVNFFSSKKNNHEKDKKSHVSNEPLVFQFDEEIELDNTTNATRSQRIKIPNGKINGDIPNTPAVKNSVAESLYVAGFNEWMLHQRNKEVRKELDALGQEKNESKKDALGREKDESKKNAKVTRAPLLIFDQQNTRKDSCNDYPVIRGFDIKISL